MEKTAILQYQDGGICLVLRVETPCPDLAETLSGAELAWNDTEEGRGTDFDSFILEYLAGHGLKARVDEDFDVYRTCL